MQNMAFFSFKLSTYVRWWLLVSFGCDVISKVIQEKITESPLRCKTESTKLKSSKQRFWIGPAMGCGCLIRVISELRVHFCLFIYFWICPFILILFQLIFCVVGLFSVIFLFVDSEQRCLVIGVDILIHFLFRLDPNICAHILIPKGVSICHDVMSPL